VEVLLFVVLKALDTAYLCNRATDPSLNIIALNGKVCRLAEAQPKIISFLLLCVTSSGRSTTQNHQPSLAMPYVAACHHSGLQLDEGEVDSVGGFRVPLPNTFRTVLTRHAGLSERITYTALHALSQYAPEDARLQELTASYDTYSDWAGEVVVSAGDKRSVVSSFYLLLLCRQPVPAMPSCDSC
jgi:hypothetical protein